MEAAPATRMNITTKGKRKSSPTPTPKLDSKRKPTPKPRNPLKDLTTLRSNTYTSSYTTSSTCSNSSSSSSSSKLSIEPSKGCLGFFLPNPISKNPSKLFNKTPKSAPISKPRSIPSNLKKTQTTHKPKTSKGSTFRGLEQTPELKSRDFKEFGSGVHKWHFSRSADEKEDGLTVTPVAGKVKFESGLDGKADVEENELAKTPPVQASTSPEIQHGSSFVATKSACYGAGHILSGVTDKRKCRPRGILAVEEEKKLGFSSDESFGGFFKSSRLSLVPSPTEASMHWLSPTCETEDDQKESLRNGATPFPSPSSGSSYVRGFSSDFGTNTNSTGNTRRSPCVFTPTAHLNFEGLSISQGVTPNEEKGTQRHSPSTEISPSSGADSLGSFNMICTPESDSGLNDSVLGLDWFKNGKGNMFEFHSTPTMSPNKRTPSGDPADVLPLPGFSFQFTHPTRPSSILFDDSQVQKAPNDCSLGFSSGSYGNFSQSQMRISWRDGLLSQMFEMEDLDFCRLSDEEEGISCQDDENLGQDSAVGDNVVQKEVVCKQPGTTDKLCNIDVLENPGSCKESITTVGSELMASSDSDWDICYRNQLFEG